MQESEFNKDKIIVSCIIQTTCIVWIITKMITWRLWTIERLFPTAPLFDFLVAPALIHLFLFAASLLLLFLLAFKPTNKNLLIGLFIAELLACLLDQSRLQPWEYQFVFIVLINIINHSQPQKVINGLAFVMISTYTYSGLGKCNASFLNLFWDNLILRGYFNVAPGFIHRPIIYYSGYGIALMELLFGIGLFFRITQKFCAWAIIVMHVLILIVVGPFGLNYNISVWPWNILMMIHLYWLFIYKKELLVNFKILWAGWNKILLVCWGILPLLNHTVDLWDNFLSSRLFAGNQPQMNLCLKDSSEIQQLKPYLSKRDRYNICQGEALVNLQTWGMKEMKSPPYTEARAYKKIAAKWIGAHTGTTTKAILYLPGTGDKIKIVTEK